MTTMRLTKWKWYYKESHKLIVRLCPKAPITRICCQNTVINHCLLFHGLKIKLSEAYFPVKTDKEGKYNHIPLFLQIQMQY